MKIQQRFQSEKQNAFIEEISKIALMMKIICEKIMMMIKKMQSNDLIETYSYEMNKDLVNKKEEIKCNNIIKQYKNV